MKTVTVKVTKLILDVGSNNQKIQEVDPNILFGDGIIEIDLLPEETEEHIPEILPDVITDMLDYLVVSAQYEIVK